MSLDEVEGRIARAAADAGRQAGDVTLLAVSKKQPEARVRAVLEAGHRIFGENRVQEAEARWEPLMRDYPDASLHLVGPLQSNKARRAVTLFDAIHSVDRPALAERLARLADEAGRCPDLFIQVDTGDEAQKAGVTPADAPALIARVRSLGLPLAGLMCIPPAEAPPAPHFARLAALAADHGLAKLSMGMSGDLEAAIAAGASHLRVGSAVFGPRDQG